MENLKIEIRYLRRARGATIRVKPNGVVRVTVPYGVREADVQKVLREKSKWILEKHKLLEESTAERSIVFKTGEKLPFLGKKLTLKITEGRGSAFNEEDTLYVPVPEKHTGDEAYIKSVVIKWYQTQAFEIIRERVQHYSLRIGVMPKSISLKNYKSRWGTCSSKGDLIFNWQIVTFDIDLFDYVVAHEVCHMKELNHGARFYRYLQELGFEKSYINRQFKYLRNIF